MPARRGRRRKSDVVITADNAMDEPVDAPTVGEDNELEAKPPTPPNIEANDDAGPSVDEQQQNEPVAGLGEAMDVSAEDGKTDSGVDDYAPELEQLDTAKAQEELSNLDVLVCGRCHNVFHFIEELLEHKKTDCPGVSEVLSNSFKPDSKPPVWAFVLYKTYKLKQKNGDWEKSSWQLYKKWCELSDGIKQTWIEAAKALQQITPFLSAVPSKIAPKNSKRLLVGVDREKTLKELQKELEDDNETEMMSSLGLQRDKGKTGKEKLTEINKIWRKPLVKKDGNDDDEVLYTAEKIVAKRANPKTKQSEYLVKWLGYPSELNAWEQIGNMENCMKLVHEFERNLAKQKARKAAEAKEKNLLTFGETVPLTPGGRPIRHSALKALDQVKEWVGGGVKRNLEDDDDEEDDVKKTDYEVSPRKKYPKNPVIVANAKGMHRVDARSVPNLSSGVYIISTQSGMIKVDDSTASKLTSCLNVEDRKKISGDSKITMINETEVRKIPASQVTPKVGILRKELQTVQRKETPTVNILQKTRPQLVRAPATTATRTPPHRQIILGGQKTRPLPGPIVSPLRQPITKPRVSIKPTTSRPRVQGAIIRTVSTPTAMIRKEKPKQLLQQQQQDEDFAAAIGEEFNQEENETGDSSRQLTLCPLTGEILNQTDDKTGDDNSMPDVDEEGMMHVAMSPGGSYHQVPAPRKNEKTKQPARSLLTQRRPFEAQQQLVEVQQQQEQQQPEQELISIEGEDGVIYQITPEQQQMLLQNGTITMDSTQDEQNRELVIENGQIIDRRMSESEQGGQEEVQVKTEDGEQMRDENMDEESYGEDGMMTLDSAVQEAVSQAAADQADKQGEQLVAQIVHADPPSGNGSRKVLLLLPDGQMIQTEMDEAQYQALEFDK